MVFCCGRSALICPVAFISQNLWNLLSHGLACYPVTWLCQFDSEYASNPPILSYALQTQLYICSKGSGWQEEQIANMARPDEQITQYLRLDADPDLYTFLNLANCKMIQNLNLRRNLTFALHMEMYLYFIFFNMKSSAYLLLIVNYAKVSTLTCLSSQWHGNQ